MARIRLLIVTGFTTLEGFQLPVENRTLLWGLDHANIDWQLFNPWEAWPAPCRYDAVLITVYRAHARNFAHYARRFEVAARAAGVPVINTADHIDGLHSFYMGRWQEHGIACARFQRFRTAADLTLDAYPLILRRDGTHRGGGMILVGSREEAVRAIERQHAACVGLYPDVRAPLPVDLAIEFVETERVDGYYCKWRCYIVGDEVIPAHFMRSRSPFVNYKDAALWAMTCDLDEVYRHEGESRPDLVRAAAAAIGVDLIALDYGIKADGTYIFWEGNRVRATAGDQHVRWLGLRDVDIEYGAAVARLVVRRVEASGHRSQRRSIGAVRSDPTPAGPSEFVVSRERAALRQAPS